MWVFVKLVWSFFWYGLYLALLRPVWLMPYWLGAPITHERFLEWGRLIGVDFAIHQMRAAVFATPDFGRLVSPHYRMVMRRIRRWNIRRRKNEKTSRHFD